MTEELEEFGVEEFGSEPVAEVEASAGEGLAELEALVEDLTKELAATMDELKRARLRKAKDAALERIAALKAPAPELSQTEDQWVSLQSAWDVVFGAGSFLKRTTADGGPTDAMFRQLTTELSEHHAANKRKRGGSKPKAEAAASVLLPDERFAGIVLHAKNCKLDAQGIFDELGLADVTDATMDALVGEINRRAGKSTTGTPPTVSEPVASDTVATESSTDSATANPSANAAADLIDCSWYDGKRDEETGEVYDRSWLLDVLGWTDFPTEPTREHADRIVDILHTRYLDPAARYRTQAEKLAAPLEKKAQAIENAFAHYLNAVGNKFLPRFQKGAKTGEFSKKTLELQSGSISWSKDGGIAITDSSKYFVWLAEKKTELLALREKGTPDALEEMAGLEKKYGIKLKTEIAYDKDLIVKLPVKELPPGWADLPVNHFARCTIK